MAVRKKDNTIYCVYGLKCQTVHQPLTSQFIGKVVVYLFKGRLRYCGLCQVPCSQMSLNCLISDPSQKGNVLTPYLLKLEKKPISFALITEGGEIISLNFRCCTRAINFSQEYLCLCCNYNRESWSDSLRNKIILNHRIRRDRKGKVSIRNHSVLALSLCRTTIPCLIYTCRLKNSSAFCRKFIPVPSSLLSFPGASAVPPGCHLNLLLFLLLLMSLTVPGTAVTKPDTALQLRPCAGGSLSSCTSLLYVPV